MGTHEARERVAELSRLLPSRGRIMLVGGPDTGKSTMAAALASWYLTRGSAVAVVDSDVGQADVGPPGFVSYGLLDHEVTSLADVPCAGSFLVGAVSPYGRLLAVVAGASTCANWAQRDGAEVVVVDTCGLVGGSAGLRLKCAKAAALCPDLILVLSPDRSLLASRLRALGYRVEVIPPLASARTRTVEERRQCRSLRWNRYLQGTQTLCLEQPSVRLARWWAEAPTTSAGVTPNGWTTPRGTVVGFADPKKPGLQLPGVWLGQDQGLGWVMAPPLCARYAGVVWTTTYVLVLAEDGSVLGA